MPPLRGSRQFRWPAFSPKGAAVNSQGCQPLDAARRTSRYVCQTQPRCARLPSVTTARGGVMLSSRARPTTPIPPEAILMAPRLQSQDQTRPTLYEGAASAAGLRADRTDISFQNVTADVVRVDVRVTNDG